MTCLPADVLFGCRLPPNHLSWQRFPRFVIVFVAAADEAKILVVNAQRSPL